jgi:hypothetical protein
MSSLLLNVGFATIANFCRYSAGHQIATNSAYGVSGQGYREILQGIMVVMLEWPAKSPGSPEGAFGSKEAGTYARKGRSACPTISVPLLTESRSRPRKQPKRRARRKSRSKRGSERSRS